MNFTFKPITFKDWEILLKWRNNPIVRKCSISTEEIKESSHKQYIKSLIKNENKKQYFFRGIRVELTTDPHKQFILKLIIKNNRLDLLTDEFFEMEK